MKKEDLTVLEENNIQNLPNVIKALWYDFQGDWQKAHELVQNEDSEDASRIHAYLHRKEGDESNARYWYRNAGEKFYHGSLDDEWEEILNSL